MADPIFPGSIGSVPVAVISVDNTAGTANVRVIDLNGAPITGQSTLPQGVITVTAPPLAVNDVIRQLESGMTVVVMWVDATNPRMWSPAVSGANPRSSIGWVKVGTFQASP